MVAVPSVSVRCLHIAPFVQISLDGIVYSPAVGGINLDLKNRWKHFGQEYRVARYIRVRILPWIMLRECQRLYGFLLATC